MTVTWRVLLRDPNDGRSEVAFVRDKEGSYWQAVAMTQQDAIREEPTREWELESVNRVRRNG